MESPQEIIDRLADKTNAWSAKNIEDGGVCDFCCALLAGRPVVTYATTKPLIEDMILIGGEGSGVLTHVSDEYWAACPDCDPVIEQANPAGLAAHVVATANYDRIGIDRDDVTETALLTEFYQRFYDATPTRSTEPPRIETP
jgi:hypothetical protein